MNIGFNMKLQLANAGIAVVLLSAGCAMAPNRPNSAAPGSTYVQEVRNTGSYGTQNARNNIKVAGVQTWQNRNVFVYENSGFGSLITVPETGLWIAVVKGDTLLISYDPPIGWGYPLEVGRSGTGKYRTTNHVRKQTFDYEWSWRVDAYEDVTVPAGTFKSYKIVTSDTLGTEGVSWWSPALGVNVKASNRRSVKHPAGAGTNDTEIVSHEITIAR